MKWKTLFSFAAIFISNPVESIQLISIEPEFPLAYDLNATWAIDCPGEKTKCADTETCCPLPNEGQFGCCPYKNGVCCSDKSHCCPHHTKCNIAAGTCEYYEDKLISIEAENLLTSLDVRQDLSTCASPHPCTQDQTCCTLPNGQPGCCPFKNGVCCANSSYCCPSGMKCDLQEMRCMYKDQNQEIRDYPLEKIDLENVKCSDDFSCADGFTCCKLFDGQFGCCPYKNAQCCADGKHCCPSGTKCDLEEGRCQPQKKAKISVKDSNICSDPRVKCPKDSTCCKLFDGQFGCCPYKNAQCCKDGAHCCPHGMTCDMEHARCTPQSFHLFYFLNFLISQQPAFRKVHKVKSAVVGSMSSSGIVQRQKCPNPEDQCLDKQTCCQISETDYGCCPFPSAVCCSDRLHCCPEHTLCDLKSDACRPKNATTYHLRKLIN